jgi:hypothetical protein
MANKLKINPINYNNNGSSALSGRGINNSQPVFGNYNYNQNQNIPLNIKPMNDGSYAPSGLNTPDIYIPTPINYSNTKPVVKTTGRVKVPSSTYVVPKIPTPLNPNYVPPTVTSTSPAPAGSTASLPGYSYVESPQEKADRELRDSINAYNKDQFNTPVDPTTIYNNTLSQYQAQIDSLNAVYNDQLNQARVQGQGRIESRQFSQGRSGQLGSGTGEAGVNAVQDANTQVYNAIEDERINAIASVYSKVRSDASASLAAKTAAKKQGADALLAELAAAPERRKANTSNAVKALLAKGVTIDQLTPEQLKSFTDGLGVSSDEFKATYATQKSVIEKAKLDAEKDQADVDKTKAEIEKLKGEPAQKALDRALQQKKIDVDWYQAQTSRINADRDTKTGQKNYDSKTIPTEVKTELYSDIVSNSNAKRKDKKTLNDFIESYPEVDTDYLTEIYEANK